MASFDPAYANSSGYFKDPVTGEDLSVDTPRVVPCSFENGKFTWPCVAASDGSQLLKIVYKYFTEEEKELYKAYRGKGSSSGVTRQRKPKEQNDTQVKQVKEASVPLGERRLVRFDSEACTTEDTEDIIKECDMCLGVVQAGGLSYAMLTKKDGKTVYWIPRALVPDDEFRRMQ